MVTEVAAKTAIETEKLEKAKKAKEASEKLKELNRPIKKDVSSSTNGMDLKKTNESKNLDKLSENKEVSNKVKDVNELPQKMEPPVNLKFTCPDGMDKKEFTRQLKGQERGINSQSVAQNIENRNNFQKRLQETGNGRSPEGNMAQKEAREKALAKRIETNQSNGMTFKEAKEEAENWIKNQAALHNPDQIAGGDPTKVSRMGDARVNSSIGRQWRDNVGQLDSQVSEFAKKYTTDELAKIKMNVKLEVA